MRILIYIIGLALLSTSQAMRIEVPSTTSGRDIEVKWTREDGDPKKLALSVTDWRNNDKRNPTNDEIVQQYRSHFGTSTLDFDLPESQKEGSKKVRAKVDGFMMVVGYGRKGDERDIKTFAFVTVGEKAEPPRDTPKPLDPVASSTQALPSSSSQSQTIPTDTPTNNQPQSSTSVLSEPSPTTTTNSGGLATAAPITPSATGVGESVINSPGSQMSSQATVSNEPPFNTNLGTPPSESAVATAESGKRNISLIAGLAVGIPLIFTLGFLCLFLLRRRRKLERRQRHLEQSAIFAAAFDTGTTGSVEGKESAHSGTNSNPQSIFAKHFRRQEKGVDRGSAFNPARMVARAWSIKTGTASRVSLAPSETFRSDMDSDAGSVATRHSARAV